MAELETNRDIALYRVGMLQALFMDWRRLTLRLGPGWWKFTSTRYELGHIAGWARQRNWRAVRGAFDGWLAEHAYAGTRAGHGWTRRRALADLQRHLAEREMS